MGGLMSYFKGLFGSREMRILILGLDGAGKTTLLYRLQVENDHMKTIFVPYCIFKIIIITILWFIINLGL